MRNEVAGSLGDAGSDGPHRSRPVLGAEESHGAGAGPVMEDVRLTAELAQAVPRGVPQQGSGEKGSGTLQEGTGVGSVR